MDYYIVFLVLRNFVGNIFFNTVVSALIELAAAFGTLYIIAKFNITKSLVFFYLIIGIMFVFASFFY